MKVNEIFPCINGHHCGRHHIPGASPATLLRNRAPRLLRLVGLLAAVLVAGVLPVHAVSNTLESVSYSTLPGEQVLLSLMFARPPPQPQTFTIDEPARIALDFPGTVSKVAERSTHINVGMARDVHTMQADGRTRVVVELAELVNYQTQISGKELTLTLGSREGAVMAAAAGEYSGSDLGGARSGETVEPTITGIDFRRGEAGQGRILVGLSRPNIPVDLREQGGQLIIDFMDAELPAALRQRLDVSDFATPIQTVDTFDAGDSVRMIVDAVGGYEHMAYQSDNLYTVEVHPVTKDEQEARRQEQFTGERLSLDFQDVEVRTILQILAQHKEFSLVAPDTVQGNITLRLKDVPWDQALDIILKSKDLDKRLIGNVLYVAPTAEIIAREKLELEAQQQALELAPLRTEYIQVNYARAADIAALLKAPENSLLTAGRGNVSVDTRTNTLLVQDTAAKLEEIRRLVARLDIPVRQVLIESRVVIASDNFSKELGVRFGASNLDDDGSVSETVSGSLDGASQLLNGDQLELNDRLNVNLPVANPAGSIGIALAKLPFGYLLELELSAAQAESRAEIVSTPRVITSNQNPARIEQGVEIPYQTVSQDGTDIEFKKAVLSLEVTPQITPDDRIIMDLSVRNDSVGQIFLEGAPSIDTREVQTQVLVDNGQTVVLGGIYEQSLNQSTSRVPFFSDIPLLGRLFRNDLTSTDKAELMIFVTPKIISEALTLAR